MKSSKKLDKRVLNILPEEKYINPVLLGNWVEERREYVKNLHDFKSSYPLDYYPKQSTSLESTLWDNRHKWQGYGARVLFDHQGFDYLENFSTLYDLSYNHFPKKSDGGPVWRKLRWRFQTYEPEPEFIKNHGNITKYGLMDFQKEKWRCDKPDPRKTVTTGYEDTFTWPKMDKQMSWGIPRHNSSIMSSNNLALVNLKLRGTQILKVPENTLKKFPCKPRCNPITWECPEPPMEPRPCIGLPIQRKRKKFEYL